MKMVWKRSINLLLLLVFVMLCGCSKNKEEDINEKWLVNANLDKEESVQELYEKALDEDILVVYTISTRVTDVKESFEKEYPGLYVEVRDLRSPDLVADVKKNYENQTYDCDVVVCNDNSADFSQQLVDTGIVVPYMPYDIRKSMKDGYADKQTMFIDEAEMIFYNTAVYDSVPISNIWELTEPSYKGKIYMPSPLRSYSTYAFCACITSNNDMMAKAYTDYCGEELMLPDGMTAGEYFFSKLVENVVFTNSSDEVMEAVGSIEGTAHFGIMVSSKLRYTSVGYNFAPVYTLNPLSGCHTTTSVMIATGSKNVNTAKLFVRWILGETDGTGEGLKPFSTVGTWSARTDVPDGNDIPLSEISLVYPDKQYIINNRDTIDLFWKRMLESE